jgi:predicted dehydrogenase
MRTVAAHVADVVMGQAAPLGSVEDAWKNLAVAVAFYEAARTGVAVRVKEVPRP